MSIVTKPGFYGGKFLKAGQFYDDSAVVSEQQADHGAGEAGEQDDPGAARAPNLGGMTKDEPLPTPRRTALISSPTTPRLKSARRSKRRSDDQCRSLEPIGGISLIGSMPLLTIGSVSQSILLLGQRASFRRAHPM